jgi:hypothetical protein
MEKITKLPNGGELHEYSDGNKYWLLNGQLHREDGPAVEYINGDKEYYIHDKLHREDGPALEDINGNKFWYLNDVRIDCTTQEEFERLMSLRVFW